MTPTQQSDSNLIELNLCNTDLIIITVTYKSEVCACKTHPSPHRTAFSTPTAAVVCLSKPCPMWSACARVRSSNSISRGSLARGRYCRFLISLVDLQWGKINSSSNTTIYLTAFPVRYRGGTHTYSEDQEHNERQCLISSTEAFDQTTL